MENIISFCKENINWIKDIFTIIFVGAATIISILAYKRARATVLQPIRNEVIKKQSKILSEVLEFISKGEKNIDKDFDYVGIAKINTYLLLKDYGFVFKNDKEIYKEIDEIASGWLYCGESKQVEDVEVIGVFDENNAKDLEKDTYDAGKKRFENLKSGVIEINRIYLTKEHNTFLGRLVEYADNPFLPNRIKENLKKIVLEVNVNLRKHLKTVLVNFMKEFSDKYFKEKVYPKISPIGIYNEFNHQRIHHKEDIRKLHSNVRDYLRIEDKW